MSTWMSIGFDPDQMDPITEPNPQAAPPSDLGTVGGPIDSSERGIVGAIKHLVARHRTLGAGK